MKTQKLKNILFFMSLAFAISLTSCTEEGGNSDDDGDENSTESKYILTVSVQVSDADNAKYILTVDDLMTGTITSTGAGIETTASSSIFTNNKLFAFGDNCDVYDYEDGKLTNNRTFAYDGNIAMVVDEDSQTIAAIKYPGGVVGTKGKIQVYDTSEGYVKNSVDTPFYYLDGENEHEENYYMIPSSSFFSNGKLFVPQNIWDTAAEHWNAPAIKKSFVSVYSYPELEFEKTITSDGIGGAIGYWYDNPCSLETESGDHYFTVSGGATSNLPDLASSIIRIKAGEEEFDTDYEFDIETTTGYRFFGGVYVGNDLAIVRVASAEKTNLWKSDGGVFNTAVVNLVDKTFKIIDDVPLSFLQYRTRFLVEDGKVYNFIKTLDGNYIYRIDPVTATAERGAKIEAYDVNGIFKTNE